MKKNFKVGDIVKAKTGAYAGKTGIIVETGGGQYDVQFSDNTIRYFGFSDIEEDVK